MGDAVASEDQARAPVAVVGGTLREDPAPEADERPPRRRTKLRRQFGPDAVAIGIGLTVAVLVLVVFYDLLSLHPRVPMLYSGDSNLAMAATRNIQLRGWFVETPQLGAPWGQDLHDYPPVGDAGHVLELFGLGSLFRDPGLVLNLFFFGSYLTVFVGAYIAGRMLAIGRVAAVMISLLYAFLPYHFQHGPGHLFLASYFAVPLWVAFFARQLGDRPLVPPLPAGRAWRPWWDWLKQPPVLAALAITVLAVTTGLYYAIFFCLIGGLVAIVIALKAGKLRPALSFGVFIGLGFAVLVAQYLPVVMFQRRHGENDIVTRGLYSVEFYSLKLSDMLLPVRGHRIDALSQWQADAQQVALTGERTEALGIIAVVGLILLFGTVVVRALRGKPAGRLGPLAVIAGIAFLLGTTGGLAFVLGVVGDLTEIRAWSRISVVIAFCALAAFGMTFDRARERVSMPQLAVVGAAAAIVVVGLLDMTPAQVFPSYDATADQWGNDRDFVEGIEAELGADASIFQLPFVPFPENPPVNRMTDYDHLRGYLHSDTLTWSYGGVKGRQDYWQQRLAKLTAEKQAEAIAAAGFDGVWLDRYGYGPELADVEAGLVAVFGPPVLTDGTGRLALFDARPLRDELVDRLGTEKVENEAAAITDPSRVRFGPGFYGPEQIPEGTYAWADGDSAVLRVQSFGADGEKVRVRFSAGAAVEGGEYDLVITGPGMEQTETITTDGTVVEFEVAVPDDEVDITLTSDAPRAEIPTDPRDLRFRVFEPTAERVNPEYRELP